MENMEWINVKDKHFVDIEHFEDGSYKFIGNENLPKGPFLVGVFSFDNKTKKWSNFNYWLVVLGDNGLEEWTEDDTSTFDCCDLLDIEYWCEVARPKKEE